MSFSEVLELLKEGKKIARNGWNGKTQYLELGTHVSFKTPSGEVVNHDNETIGNKAIIFHGTIGTQVGWLASQGDLLSEDWYVVE